MALQPVKHTTHVQHHSSSMQALLPGGRPCSCIARAPAALLKQIFTVRSKEQREVGCSDLYNMTEAIKAQSQLDQTPQSTALPASSDAAQLHHQQNEEGQPGSSVEESPAAAAGTNKGISYYAGLVTTDLQVDNKASGADILKRSLQLAGGVAGLLALLTYLFLASNNLV